MSSFSTFRYVYYWIYYIRLYLWGLLTMIYRGHKGNKEKSLKMTQRFVHIIKNFKMKMIMLIMMEMVIGKDLIHTTMMINTMNFKKKRKSRKYHVGKK